MRRISVWLWLSTILTVIFFMVKGVSLLKLSPKFIQRTGAYPYAVLLLCALLLFSKRETIYSELNGRFTPITAVTGLIVVLLSFLFPVENPPIQIFAVLLLWIGAFTAVFGRAARLPVKLLAIYGFAIAFPVLISNMGSSFPLMTTAALTFVLGPFVSIGSEGQIIRFFDAGGGSQTYFIDAACSGSAAIAIFLAVFFLMLIDRPVPPRRVLPLLFFGLVGTTLQNLLRLVILVGAGYFYGRNALWSTHTYVGYILFPLWYAFFVYIYIREAKSMSTGKGKGLGAAPA